MQEEEMKMAECYNSNEICTTVFEAYDALGDDDPVSEDILKCVNTCHDGSKIVYL